MDLAIYLLSLVVGSLQARLIVIARASYSANLCNGNFGGSIYAMVEVLQ